jgi:alpha,alpha-trehalase
MLATIDAIADRLTDEHGQVYRYRIEDGVDGLTGAEGTFLPAVHVLVGAGPGDGGTPGPGPRGVRPAGHANDVGLLAEEVDPATGDLLDDFPQAFSHIGLVNAAWAIRQAEQRRDADQGRPGTS